MGEYGEERELRRKGGAPPLPTFCATLDGGCWTSYSASRPRKSHMQGVKAGLLEIALLGTKR
jgi:hypothetical protein